MKNKVERPNITFNADSTINVTFKLNKDFLKELETISGDSLSLEIKEWREARSLNQNAYLWTLLHKLASKLNDTSENIYRHFVRDYGVKEFICVKDEAVEELQKRWTKQGIGWFSDILRKGKIDGTTTVILFYGSSTYDQKEMSNLVEAVVESCEENGIPTLTMEQFSKLKNEND